MQTSIKRVVELLDHTPRSALEFGELLQAVEHLRLDLRDRARELRRATDTLKVLERDSTRSRDGDKFQNRAIAVVRSLGRDLKIAIERESSIRKAFGRGYTEEFIPAAHRIDALRDEMVANRTAGFHTATEECLHLTKQAEAILRQGDSLGDERELYLAALTLTRGLITLSMLDTPSDEDAEDDEAA